MESFLKKRKYNLEKKLQFKGDNVGHNHITFYKQKLISVKNFPFKLSSMFLHFFAVSFIMNGSGASLIKGSSYIFGNEPANIVNHNYEFYTGVYNFGDVISFDNHVPENSFYVSECDNKNICNDVPSLNREPCNVNYQKPLDYQSSKNNCQDFNNSSLHAFNCENPFNQAINKTNEESENFYMQKNSYESSNITHDTLQPNVYHPFYDLNSGNYLQNGYNGSISAVDYQNSLSNEYSQSNECPTYYDLNTGNVFTYINNFTTTGSRNNSPQLSNMPTNCLQSNEKSTYCDLNSGNYLPNAHNSGITAMDFTNNPYNLSNINSESGSNYENNPTNITVEYLQSNKNLYHDKNSSLNIANGNEVTCGINQNMWNSCSNIDNYRIKTPAIQTHNQQSDIDSFPGHANDKSVEPCENVILCDDRMYVDLISNSQVRMIYQKLAEINADLSINRKNFATAKLGDKNQDNLQIKSIKESKIETVKYVDIIESNGCSRLYWGLRKRTWSNVENAKKDYLFKNYSQELEDMFSKQRYIIYNNVDKNFKSMVFEKKELKFTKLIDSFGCLTDLISEETLKKLNEIDNLYPIYALKQKYKPAKKNFFSLEPFENLIEKIAHSIFQTKNFHLKFNGKYILYEYERHYFYNSLTMDRSIKFEDCLKGSTSFSKHTFQNIYALFITSRNFILISKNLIYNITEDDELEIKKTFFKILKNSDFPMCIMEKYKIKEIGDYFKDLQYLGKIDLYIIHGVLNVFNLLLFKLNNLLYLERFFVDSDKYDVFGSLKTLEAFACKVLFIFIKETIEGVNLSIINSEF